jgi:hypothetical protein
MTDEEITKWAKEWVRLVEESPVAQDAMTDPDSRANVLIYADSLRSRLSNVSDTDIARMLIWVGDFIVLAKEKLGGYVPPDALLVTFCLTAHELLQLEKEF